MKAILLAVFIAFLAVGFQTQAAVSSLPIGSVDRVLKNKLVATRGFDVTVEVLNHPHADTPVVYSGSIPANGDNVSDGVSYPNWGRWSYWYQGEFNFGAQWYTNASGAGDSVKNLVRRFTASGDRTEIKTVLQKLMSDAMTISGIDPNDPVLQGKTIRIRVESLYEVPEFLIGYMLINNEFVLGSSQDAQGRTIIPESAYATDLDTPILTYPYQLIYVSGVTRGEVRAPAQGTQGGLFTTNLVPNLGDSGGGVFAGKLISIDTPINLGQWAGVLQLWYVDGTTQMFRLSDGSLIPAVPVITIGPTAVGGIAPADLSGQDPTITVTVSGVPGLYILEWSEDLKTWYGLAGLSNSTGSASMVDSSVGKARRFYRASFTSP